MKKTLALLLAMIMVMTVFPVTSYASYGVYVNGSSASTVTCGSGTASWNSSTKTLTLNNATITQNSGSSSEYYAGIYFGSDISNVTIMLVGDNTISTSTYQNSSSYATIYAENANITIMSADGTGSLTLDGIYEGEVNYINYGIVSKNGGMGTTVTVKDCSLNINSRGNAINAGSSSAGSVVIDNAKVLLNGGSTITAKTVSVKNVEKYRTAADGEYTEVSTGATVTLSPKPSYLETGLTEPTYYNATWYDWDGTELYSQTDIPSDEEPVYAASSLPARESTAQYEYSFNGWETETDAESGDMSMTATYTSVLRKYIVSWKDYDGTGLETDTDVPYGTVPEFNGSTPTNIAGPFIGWDPEVSEVEGDATYTAKYDVIEYTITYELDGGENGEGNPATYTSLDSVTFTDATKTGYTFGGWYTRSDCTGDNITGIAAGTTGNMTLYADFEANSYTINYDANGGEGNQMDPTAATYGTEVTLRSNAYTYDGYDFLGWARSSDTDTAEYSDCATVTDLCEEDGGNVTLYAVWGTLGTYEITATDAEYDANEHGATVLVNGVETETEISYKGTLRNGDPYSDTDAPVHAGTYTATTLDARGNEISVGYSITPRLISITGSDVEFIYDGNNHVPTVTVTNLATATDDITVSIGPAHKDAGKYTAYAKVINSPDYTAQLTVSSGIRMMSAAGSLNALKSVNYVESAESESSAGTVSIDWEIVPLTVELEWTNTDLVYNGGEQIPVAKVTNATGTDVVTVKVIASETDAGDYVATATDIDNGNYALPTDTDLITCDWTISPLVATLTWTDTNYVYDGEEHVPTATVDNLATDSDVVSVTVIASETDAGEYLATATELDNGNYVIATETNATCEWKIDPRPVTVTWTNLEFTYDAEEHIPTAEAENLVDGDDLEIIAVEPQVNADDYTATATSLTGTDAKNYTLESGTNLETAWVINPRPVVLAWTNTDVIYNAKEQIPVASVTNLATDSDVVNVSVIASETDAGEYVATATDLDNTNYTLVSGTNVTTEWIIERRQAKLVPLSGQGKTRGKRDGTLMYRIEEIPGIEESGLAEGDELNGKLNREEGEMNGRYYYDFDELIELNPNYEFDCDDDEYFEIWNVYGPTVIHIPAKTNSEGEEESNPETGAPVMVSAVPAMILSLAAIAVGKRK